MTGLLDVHDAGPLPRFGPGGLIPIVDAAGLTGRGGGGFPTARKMAAVVAAGREPVVVANGVEGEPASAKDRTLLARAPHLVLDGLVLAAEAVGAREAYVFASETDGVHRALAGRRDPCRITVVDAPRRFVAGAEQAVVAGVEGRAPLPRDTPRRVVEVGVRGRPTLVQNVETLAHLALIARYGPDRFRDRGTADEPGTLLVTVSGAVAAPGVYEVDHGTPLVDVFRRAGGLTGALRAALVGGYHGGWVPAPLGDVPLSRAGLGPYGVTPGAGVLVALPASRCGLVESARILAYLAGEGTGRCGPCRFGLPRLAAAFSHSVDIESWAELVERRGACQHPDGTARFARSALAAFADDVRLHSTGRCEVTA